MNITNVKFMSAPTGLLNEGLLGWISCVVDERPKLDGLTLRRTADDRITLSFPMRTDGHGCSHFYIRPVDDASRRDVEQQVFVALGLDEGTRP
jgi:hypothetical protein